VHLEIVVITRIYIIESRLLDLRVRKRKQIYLLILLLQTLPRSLKFCCIHSIIKLFYTWKSYFLITNVVLYSEMRFP